MAKAKSKPRGANRYTPPAKSNAPGWIWLVAGIVIGGFIMFLMKLEPKQDIRSDQPTTASIHPKDNPNKDNKLTFVFSKMLSGNEVPQQPLTEEQRKKLDGDRAAALLEDKTPPVTPPPAITQPAPTQPTTTTPTVTSPSVTPKPQPTQIATITPPTDMYFFLQVGSYPTKSGAESTRAQILMLGQDVKIETSQANNKTWYRVLVGPFKNKDEATKAQKQLANSGFNRTLLVPRKTL